MFNIGDKVLFGKYLLSKIEYEAFITDKHELNPNRYFITIEKQFNKQGDQVKRWVDVTDIRIDKQYYRNIKINQIIND
jgi:hypothetical protein